MGNGAKAAQKRERNAKESQSKGGKSQLKSNQASKTIVCKVCKNAFMSTTRQPQLLEHAQNKHSKTYEDCFDPLN
ncbi:hypothetical protein PNOK_0176500 [Pyrrhoderma noxium]|uniref:Uncharacterized protein n=1 Tax=Pyrrhoderma noxium TaxID=2282107 RepID=A0A286UQD5_9AGAM|nr:hypothetical protein PNOK_0176500 [Pyrrhoderma noxium]